jgi:hypothetical protein
MSANLRQQMTQHSENIHTYKMNMKGTKSWPLKDADEDERFAWFIDLFFCKWGLLGFLNS